jgi:hypothetical protein
MPTDTTTLLEERFLSSGFRCELLNDKLAELIKVRDPIKDPIHWIECIPCERTWLDDSFGRMRIVYKLPVSAPYIMGIRAIEGYLRACYGDKTTLDEATFLYARTVEFTVELAPMDSAWIKQVVSSPEKGK